MKAIRRSPVLTGILFLLAVILLFAGSIGGTQAAFSDTSEDYYSALNMDHIGVTLLENGNPAAARNYGSTAAAGFSGNLDGNLVLENLGTDTSFQVGKKYPFVISAQNSGTIAQYIRVKVYRYWVNVGPSEAVGTKGWFHGLSSNSTKIINDQFDPALIHTGYLEEDYNSASWILDTNASSDERRVYYYKGSLGVGAPSAVLYDSLWIDPSVAQAVSVTTTREGNKTITTYTYAYDGYGFVVQAEVDAVQTHNARDAVRSAWGLQDTAIMDQMGLPA